MAMLDLGFSSFEHASSIIAAGEARSLATTWMLDWEIVSLLDEINFVCDAPMYRMYCAEFGIDCDYSDEECIELANKQKDAIFKYQRDLLKNIVFGIYDKWTGYVESGRIIPALPPSAKVALMNFINTVRRMAESEYAPHFVGMFGSLAEAHQETNSCNTDVSDVQETISKDQFKSYCDIMKDRIAKPFTSEDELEIKRFNTRMSIVKKILMSIMWMCEPEHYNKVYSSDVLFDRWILPYIQGNPIFNQYLAMFMNRKSMPMAYAIAATPETIEFVKEDEDSYPVTDSTRLALTVAIQQYKETVNE